QHRRSPCGPSPSRAAWRRSWVQRQSQSWSLRGATARQRARGGFEHADHAHAVLGARPRRFTALRGADEMRQLGRERFYGRNTRNENITLANREALAERSILGRTVHALIVDPQLFARLHIVKYHHLLGAYNGEFPLFVRIEPRHLDVRQHPARELHREKHDVLDRGLQI